MLIKKISLPQTSISVMRFMWLLVFIQLPQLAFPEQFLHREFNIAEGLGNPYVYALAQDQNRLIWIGTAEGLYQYNGKKFTPYYTRNGLATNFIYSLLIDTNNNKWIGHDEGSISVFDDKKIVYRRPDSLINSRINKLVQKRNRHILVCTQGNGLLEIDSAFSVISIVSFDEDEIVWDVAEMSQGHLIAGTNQGVYFIENINGVYQKKKLIDGLQDISVINVIRSGVSNDEFIIATEFNGLFELQVEETLAFRVKKMNEKYPDNSDQLFFSAFDSKNQLWMSRLQSGVSQNIVNGRQIKPNKSYWQQKGASFYFKSFLEDQEGNYWLGTYGNGLFQLTNNIFLLFKPEQLAGKNFNVKAVSACGDTLLAATSSELYLYSIQSSEFKKITIKTLQKQGKTPLVISSILCDKKSHKILIGTTGFGVLDLNLSTQTAQSWYYNSTDVPSNNIKQIVRDRKNNIWIATENGAVLYDDVSKKFRTFSMNDGLAHNNVNAIYADHKNRVWFATYGSGLSYFENDAINFIPSPFKNKGIDINCFAEDTDTSLWAGTNGEGIVCIKDATVTHYITRQSGLLSNFCYTLSFNASGNLWVGHKNGLSEVMNTTLKVNTTANSDLLQDIETNFNALTVDPNNITWYGTNKGLLRYNPFDESINNTENVNLVTGMKIFFNHPDSNKYKYLRNFTFPPDNLKLSYKDNHVTIEFIGICFSDPNKVLYKYYLEGYDNTWSPETYQNYVTFSNLPAGQYVFHLISMNQNGVWNKKPTLFRFEIIPPFYKTWWFYVLMVLIFFFAIIMVFSYRTKQLRKRNELLEKEKTKLESEILQRKIMEEKLKKSELQLQLANEELNTFIWRSYHDLRGPLKTIQGLVYIALSETKKKMIVSYLEMINETSSKLDSLLRQFSKATEVRRSKMVVAEIDIQEVINSCIVSIAKMYNIHDAVITRDIRLNAPVYFDHNFIYTIFHHIIENSFQFCQGNKPVIHIVVRQYRTQIKIIISDDGVGIGPDSLPEVFDMFYKGNITSRGYGLGMYIVKKIVQVLEGSIYIYSEEYKGTTVYLRIKNQSKLEEIAL